MDNKIYREKVFGPSIFLGGPLVIGYFMANNYMVFGKPELARKAKIFSAFFTVVLFTSIAFIPEEVNIPNQIIPLIYSGIGALLVHKYQGDDLKSHVENGGSYHNGWKAFFMGLLYLLITFGGFFVAILLFV